MILILFPKKTKQNNRPIVTLVSFVPVVVKPSTFGLFTIKVTLLTLDSNRHPFRLFVGLVRSFPILDHRGPCKDLDPVPHPVLSSSDFVLSFLTIRQFSNLEEM